MAERVGEAASSGSVIDWRNQDWSSLPPSERLVTLPLTVPERTLGYGVLKWIGDNLVHPNGDGIAGQPFRCTKFQALFILNFYAVDEKGDFVYNEGVRRLAKGSGKSPFAAVLALAELLGPVRFHSFNDLVYGGCVGRSVPLAWVQVAAVSEEQTKNTMRMVRAILTRKECKLKQKYGLDIGKTYVESADGRKLEQITSSATTAEGNEITFAVADETEHWYEATGGRDLYDTLTRNLSKTRNARMVQTSNAWEPGSSSIAETTFEAWCEEQSGNTRASKLTLYDSIVAPEFTSLTNDAGEGEITLLEALAFVYQDCPWVDLDTIANRIWKPNFPQARAWQYNLNRPRSPESAWCPPGKFMECYDPERVVEPGESIVMFFDGSKSNDHTALVGCCMSDGFIFTLGVWKPDKDTGVVDFAAVDSMVMACKERYDVVAFWADVREWESYVKSRWADFYRDSLVVWSRPDGKLPEPIAWDMRRTAYQFGQATEMCLNEIENHEFTHDGNWELVKHVGNCRVKDYRGTWSVRKESPKSRKKIDAAVCMIGARMLYRIVSGNDKWVERASDPVWVFG